MRGERGEKRIAQEQEKPRNKRRRRGNGKISENVKKGRTKQKKKKKKDDLESGIPCRKKQEGEGSQGTRRQDRSKTRRRGKEYRESGKIPEHSAQSGLLSNAGVERVTLI